MNLIFLFVLFIVQLAFGQVPLSGQCPDNIKTVQQFDVDKYMGKWYEYSKYPFRYEIGGKCMYAIYNKLENGTILVLNTQIKISTGKRSSTAGTADTTDEPGKLLVKFPKSKNEKPNYWILGTDYTSYVVVYNCVDKQETNEHLTVVWILTRSRTPPKESIELAHNLLDSNQISKSHLSVTDQNDCPPDDDDIDEVDCKHNN